MTFKLEPLPFAKNGLEPFLTEDAMNYHYDKQHQGYVQKLNLLIENSLLASLSLMELISSSNREISNCASQIWNHDFYWQCLTPKENSYMSRQMESILSETFGTLSRFELEFSNSANNHFGVGWVWLCRDSSGQLIIVALADAENPMTLGLEPLLTLDLWEHAYYLDYRHMRSTFIAEWWKYINWNAVEKRVLISSYSRNRSEHQPRPNKVHGPIHTNGP